LSTDIEKLPQSTQMLKRLQTLLKLQLNCTILHCFVDPYYVTSILTLHNQSIVVANVKTSNRCAYDLRLSCTFVVGTLNLPTPFNIIFKYLNQHIPRKRLQASSCSFQFAGLGSFDTLKFYILAFRRSGVGESRPQSSDSSMVDPDPYL